MTLEECLEDVAYVREVIKNMTLMDEAQRKYIDEVILNHLPAKIREKIDE